jgi:hypothetical protein
MSAFEGEAEIIYSHGGFLSLTRNGHAATGVSIVTYAFGRRFGWSRLDHCYAPQADATLGENAIGGVLYVSA